MLLRAFIADMAAFAVAFTTDMARLPVEMARSARAAWDDFLWLEQNRRGR